MQYGLMKNEVINFIDTNSFVEKHQNHGEKVMYLSDKRGDKPFEPFEKKNREKETESKNCVGVKNAWAQTCVQ